MTVHRCLRRRETWLLPLLDLKLWSALNKMPNIWLLVGSQSCIMTSYSLRSGVKYLVLVGFVSVLVVNIVISLVYTNLSSKILSLIDVRTVWECTNQKSDYFIAGKCNNWTKQQETAEYNKTGGIRCTSIINKMAVFDVCIRWFRTQKYPSFTSRLNCYYRYT